MELRIKKAVLTSCHRFKGKTIVIQVESSFTTMLHMPAIVQLTIVKVERVLLLTTSIEWLVSTLSMK